MIMKRFISLGLLLSSLCMAFNSQAAPKSDLWDFWSAHNADNSASISHTAWDKFLKKYIKTDKSGLNRLPYDKIDSKDKAALDAYIKKLSGLSIRNYNRKEQRAYWSNLYNALTVQVVIEHMPIESILDISSGFFSKGPWKEKRLTIEGKEVSLDDIEHRILRPIWKDPLTHYAVNCASVGCPNLQNYAFTADNMKKNLPYAAFQFINSPRGVQIKDGKLTVSSIYDWFKTDFGGSDAGVIKHLIRHAKPDLADQLSRINEIDGDQYDWQLNIVQ